MNLAADDPVAVAVVSAIHACNLSELERLLQGHPGLATARIVDAKGAARTLLHIVADWPGHFPNGRQTVSALIAAGADVNAPMIGPHAETPLHWAASSNDVAVLDALLDSGADIEAPGAVFTGGSPMSDAVVFAQWHAARRLLERGARTTLWQAAALGLLDHVEECCSGQPAPSTDEITNALWHACHGGQRRTAEYLLGRGANLNWIGYEHRTPLQAVREPQLAFSPYTPDQYLDIAEQNRIFDGVIASTISDVLLTGTSNPERLRGNFVTINTFGILGVAPLLGRYILPSDGAADAAPVAVLGYRFWKNRFGGDPHVIGAQMRLNDKLRTVVGVMPKRFMWRGADVYLPIVFERGQVIESVHYINVIGRLKRGVNAAQADTDLHPIVERMLAREPSYQPAAFHVTLRDFYETYPSSIRKQLWILLSAVAVLLALACANASNLLLARAAARSREMAVRVSLGAGRWRIMRQLLTESLMIGAGSAALGAALAYAMLSAVVSIIPPDTIPDESEVSLNRPVLLFALGVSLLTAVLAGLAPAWHASRSGLAGALRAGRGLSGNLHEGRLRKSLVGAEVALAMLLLVGASLVLRTLFNLQHLDFRYRPEAVLSMQIPLTENRYGAIGARNQFLSLTLERIQALPGVDQAALNSFVHPFANWGMRIDVSGSDIPQPRPVVFSQISAGYPAVLHLSLRQGRFFTDQDIDSQRHAALVNETLARTYFKDGSALAKTIGLPELKGEPIRIADDRFTIEGVVADVKNVGLENETYPEIYVPYTTTGFREAAVRPLLLVTAHVPPQNLAQAIQREIHAVDPDQPVMLVETVQKLLDDQGLAGPRFSVFLFSAFAVLGLALCAVGIYSVVNYWVSSQMQSLGVRIALGARAGSIFALVFGESLKVLLAGVLAGAAGGLLATRWLSSLIWGVSSWDPLSFTAVAVVLLSAGFAACLRPAWRAIRVDPASVLRHE